VRWILLFLLLAANAVARPLEIRARSRIEAHGQKRNGVILIHGTLLDDGGAALKRQQIAFATNSPVALTRCMNSTEVDSVETDTEGHFCVALRGARDPLRITLAYKGTDSVERATLELPVDPNKSTLAIRIAPTPLLVLLDDKEWKLEAFVSSQDLGTPKPERAAELLLLADANRVLAKGITDETGRLTFRLDPSELGAPGPGELLIRYAGTEAIAPYEMHFPIERRARVSLALLQEEITGGQRARVTATWKGGVVPVGNVECRLGSTGLPLGAAHIDNVGNADLVIADADGEEGATLRYVPQVSYFEAGAPLDVKVKPAPRSHLTAILSLLLLVGVLGWTIRLRAPSKPRLVEREEAPAAPTIEVLARSAAPVWSGVVLDAHTKTPLAGVGIAALLPGFDAARALARTRSSETGAFELHLPDSGHTGITLLFEGELHGDVQIPAPPFGEVRINLHSRRRRLLEVFAAAFSRGKERTPQEVIQDTASPEVAAWVARVEDAVYGPAPVDRGREERIGKPPRE
jgi:hypothetical protein